MPGTTCAANWLIEVAELSSVRKSAVEAVKAFLSRQIDHFRPAYGKLSQDFPRSCGFFGTTNEPEPLKDDTGGRRNWVFESRVRTHAERDAAIAALRLEHPQLWAEAVVAFKAGETWWLDAAEEAQAEVEQEARRTEHPWEELVRDFVANEPYVRVMDIMQNLEIPPERQTEFTVARIAGFLRRLGWTKAKDCIRNGIKATWWDAPTPAGPFGQGVGGGIGGKNPSNSNGSHDPSDTSDTSDTVFTYTYRNTATHTPGPNGEDVCGSVLYGCWESGSETSETSEGVNKAGNSDTYASDGQNGRVSEVSEGTPPTPGQNAPAWDDLAAWRSRLLAIEGKSGMVALVDAWAQAMGGPGQPWGRQAAAAGRGGALPEAAERQDGRGAGAPSGGQGGVHVRPGVRARGGGAAVRGRFYSTARWQRVRRAPR